MCQWRIMAGVQLYFTKFRYPSVITGGFWLPRMMKWKAVYWQRLLLEGGNWISCSVGCLINDFSDNDIDFTYWECHHFQNQLWYAICLLTSSWCYQLLEIPEASQTLLQNNWHLPVTFVIGKVLDRKRKICSELSMIWLFK